MEVGRRNHVVARALAAGAANVNETARVVGGQIDEF
jgi:hypothetical protein